MGLGIGITGTQFVNRGGGASSSNIKYITFYADDSSLDNVNRTVTFTLDTEFETSELVNENGYVINLDGYFTGDYFDYSYKIYLADKNNNRINIRSILSYTGNDVTVGNFIDYMYTSYPVGGRLYNIVFHGVYYKTVTDGITRRYLDTQALNLNFPKTQFVELNISAAIIDQNAYNILQGDSSAILVLYDSNTTYSYNCRQTLYSGNYLQYSGVKVDESNNISLICAIINTSTKGVTIIEKTLT